MLIPISKYHRVSSGKALIASFVCAPCKEKKSVEYRGNRASRKEYIEFGVHKHDGELFCDFHFYEFFE